MMPSLCEYNPEYIDAGQRGEGGRDHESLHV
jgi:hypothetical protein